MLMTVLMWYVGLAAVSVLYGLFTARFMVRREA